MNVIATAAPADSIPLGVGYYTAPEAARLLRIAPRTVNRWLGGYTYRARGIETEVPPLWRPELPRFKDHLELGFRDLIELRFVIAFVEAGLGLLAIRNCIEYARECVQSDRPFSTRRFQTDGRTIFLDSLQHTGEAELLDLKRRQYVFKAAVDRTFKDLELDNEMVKRWRPFQGRKSIIIDPMRTFGQPILSDYGIPTIVLAEAAEAEGSQERAAFLYDVPARAVKDAIQFEAFIHAA